jgi:hypothetical protein
MNPVLALARPDILQLQPYQHASWDPSLERMHANEMPWRAQGDNTQAGLNRYPEPQPRALVERMARLYDVPAANVLVGRGSDEAIDLLVRAFCRAGEDSVLITPPTFGFYKVAARIQGAGVIEVPLLPDSFALDVPAVLEAGRRAKIVFLCSPNNPTGNLLDESALLGICRELADRALVCVDEAYIEFAARASLTTRLAEFPNLVVLRTLSKAYALAGARLGTLIASEDIVGAAEAHHSPVRDPGLDRRRGAGADRGAAARDGGRAHPHAARRARAGRSDSPAGRRRARVPVRRQLPAGPVPGRSRGARRRQGRRPAGARFQQRPGARELPALSIGTPEQNERLLAALERL